ncbi:hypothetical protein F5884DRAFT_802110 [Xylogone sp. PMI_703]|nr:hypothetical protein F5884DRAFT_802110 [Xylogone sp. PMI_703]
MTWLNIQPCSAISLALLLSLASTATSLAISPEVFGSDAQLVERQSAGESCGFEGNSDIYGLGIRLGIYFGWISSCISFHGRFNERWSTGLVDVATIFEIAIFIATVVLATDLKSTVYSVELMLMTLIFFGDFYFVQIAAVLSYRNFSGMFSLAGLILRFALCIAMLSFAVWLWFPGFDQFQQTPCGSYVFIFAKVPIAVSGVRKFLRALACIHMLLWTLPLAMGLFPCLGALLMGFMIILIEALMTDRNGKDGRLGFLASAASFWQTPLEDLGGDDKGDSQNEEPPFWDTDSARRKRRNALFVLPVLIAIMIIAVELTIAFNSISGVYTIKSTGQLIPFVIGVGGIWSTINDLLADYYKEKTKYEERMEAEAKAAESQKVEGIDEKNNTGVLVSEQNERNENIQKA